MPTLSAQEFAQKYGPQAVPTQSQAPATLSADDFAKRYGGGNQQTDDSVGGMGSPFDFEVTGPAKGIGSTLWHLGKLASNTPLVGPAAKDAADRLAQLLGLGPSAHTEEAFATPPAALAATNPAQKAGKFLEQAGEFLVPGAAEAGVLAPAAKLATKAGMFGSAVTGGATGAGVSAAQGENPVVGGVLGAAAPIVGKVAETVAPEMINSLLATKSRLFRTGANAGRGVVNEGIVAPTMSRMASKISDALDSVGQKIGTMIGLSPRAQTMIDVTNSINGPIDKAIPSLQALGDSAGVARLGELRAGLNDAFTQLKSSVSGATPGEVFQVKKLLDQGINHLSPEGTDASVKEVVRTIRRNLASEIQTAVPEITPLNKRYADLASAMEAVTERANATHGLGSMQSFIRSPLNYLVGAPVAYMTHSPLKTALAIGATKALTSTPVVTTAAQAVGALGKTGVQRGLVGGAMAAGGPEEAPAPTTANDHAISAMDGLQTGHMPSVYNGQAVYVDPDGNMTPVPVGARD